MSCPGWGVQNLRWSYRRRGPRWHGEYLVDVEVKALGYVLGRLDIRDPVESTWMISTLPLMISTPFALDFISTKYHKTHAFHILNPFLLGPQPQNENQAPPPHQAHREKYCPFADRHIQSRVPLLLLFHVWTLFSAKGTVAPSPDITKICLKSGNKTKT